MSSTSAFKIIISKQKVFWDKENYSEMWCPDHILSFFSVLYLTSQEKLLKKKEQKNILMLFSFK